MARGPIPATFAIRESATRNLSSLGFGIVISRFLPEGVLGQPRDLLVNGQFVDRSPRLDVLGQVDRQDDRQRLGLSRAEAASGLAAPRAGQLDPGRPSRSSVAMSMFSPQ
jgi:hypothetical protein